MNNCGRMATLSSHSEKHHSTSVKLYPCVVKSANTKDPPTRYSILNVSKRAVSELLNLFFMRCRIYTDEEMKKIFISVL
jgi:hypothetical protein